MRQIFKHPNPEVRTALAWSLAITAILAAACVTLHLLGLAVLSRVSFMLFFVSCGPSWLLLLHESDYHHE